MSTTKLTLLVILLVNLTTSTKNTIRIGTVDLPGFVDIEAFDASGDPVKFSGLAFDYVDWLTRRLQLSPDLAKVYVSSKDMPSPSIAGWIVNGTWTGLMGHMYREEIDWAVYPITAKAITQQDFEQSFPFTTTSFSAYIPYPATESSMWAFLKPFDVRTWLLLATSFLTATTAQWCLAIVSIRRAKKKVPYVTTLLGYYAVVTGQGADWHYRIKRSLILGSTWCLVSVVFVNAYNGLLITYLTTDSPKPIINTLNDLVTKPDVKFYVLRSSYPSFYFSAAATEPEKTLGQILESQPERSVSTFSECFSKVETGPNACILTNGIADNYAHARYKVTGRCTITRSSAEAIAYNPSFIFRNDFPYFAEFNKGVIEARSFGLDLKWTSKYAVQDDRCNRQQPKTATLRKIPMKNLYGAFIVLFFGVGLAFVMFVYENCSFALMKKGK